MSNLTKILSNYTKTLLACWLYSYQSFISREVLTAKKMIQLSDNIRDHQHGDGAVVSGLSLKTEAGLSPGALKMFFPSVEADDVNKVITLLVGVSSDGTDPWRLTYTHNAEVPEPTSEGCTTQNTAAAVSSTLWTVDFGIRIITASAANIVHGKIVFYSIDSNEWVCAGELGFSNTPVTENIGGYFFRNLFTANQGFQLETIASPNDFDAGKVNVSSQ